MHKKKAAPASRLIIPKQRSEVTSFATGAALGLAFVALLATTAALLGALFLRPQYWQTAPVHDHERAALPVSICDG